MVNFRKFYVKPKFADEDEDAVDWNEEKYPVLAFDYTLERVPVEEETPKEDEKELVKSKDLEDEEELEEETMLEDMQLEEQITGWVMLGNKKTGELRFFDLSDVVFVSD